MPPDSPAAAAPTAIPGCCGPPGVSLGRQTCAATAGAWRAARRDRRGAAAVETALLAGLVLLPLWLGGMALVQVGRDSLRVWRVAEEVATVVSQYEVVRTGPAAPADDLAAVLAVAREAARPMRLAGGDADGAVIVSSLEGGPRGTATLIWQERAGRASAASRFGTAPGPVDWGAVASALGVPNPRIAERQGAVLVEVFAERSPLADGLAGAAGVALGAGGLYGFSLQKPRAAAVLRLQRMPPS